MMHAAGVFLVWWAGELKTLMPRTVNQWFADDPVRVVLRVGEQLTQVIIHSDEKTEILGEYSSDEDANEQFLSLAELIKQKVPEQATVEMELPEDHLLRHQVLLPQTVEPTLSDVLRFEIDRLTPFNDDQIGYTWRVVQRIPEQDKLKVELIVVRRDYLTKLIAQASVLGLKVNAAYPVGARGEEEGKHANSKLDARLLGNMLPQALLPESEALWNRRNKRLLSLALLLSSAIIIYPISMQCTLIEQLEIDIKTISHTAHVAGEKRRLLVAYLDGHELVVGKKNNSPAKIEIIKKLTEYLPDNTWVSRLVIDDESVLLKGESLKSSGLIETLDHVEFFENVEFVSPVIRNASTNLERYEIRLMLSGKNK